MTTSTKEGMDHLSGGSTTNTNRRRASGPKAGSVWESRMKLDEVKGGIKVFTPTYENSEENNTPTMSPNTTNPVSPSKTEKSNNNTMRPKQSPVGLSGKRKTWKSDSSEGSPVQIARQRSELGKNMDELCKESSVSADGIRKSPSQIKKTRSANGNAIQLLKPKTDSSNERNSDLRKTKSETIDGESVEAIKSREIVVTYDNVKNSDDERSKKEVDEGIEKFPVEIKNSRSDEELGVCEEKTMMSVSGNADQNKASLDEEEGLDEGEDEVDDMEIEVEIEKKSVEVKEISIQEKKPKKIVVEEKKLLQSNERPIPISPIAKKQTPPVVNHVRILPTPTKTKRVSDHFNGSPRTHSKLQSFVDLVMWRDVSKSAFVFGIGTFGIISSSYSKDLNISFISVVSYLGLVYLAANFLFRSLINRGSNNMHNRDHDYVVGEEEAIWFIKLVLPYINEFLLKLRALFSGDPGTTMKLAVLLFILARCGSSITIWKMVKLGFFGVFIVPKVCSSYSHHLTAYGAFWIRRFRDAWESCSHKKAVGFAIFTLIWNLSSVVARVWAVFMLFVGFKYYQQSLLREGCVQQEASNSEAGEGVNFGAQRPVGRRSKLTEIRKQKKVL